MFKSLAFSIKGEKGYLKLNTVTDYSENAFFLGFSEKPETFFSCEHKANIIAKQCGLENFTFEAVREQKYVVVMSVDDEHNFRVELFGSKTTYTNDLNEATKYETKEDFKGLLGCYEHLVLAVRDHGVWSFQ